MKIEVRISLPPIGCSPNKGGNRMASARARKQQRSATCYAAMAAKRAAKFPCLTQARITVEFLMGQRLLFPSSHFYRPRDRQNAIASLKGAVDGLVDAGVILDDNHKVLDWGDVTLKRSAKEHQGKAGVILTIESMEDGTDALAEN